MWRRWETRMGLAGERLREIRQRRGISLDELAELTKIRASYLAAIEEGNYDKIPAEVFVRGFITQYAQVLNEDPQPFLDLYREERGAREEEAARSQAEKDRAAAMKRLREETRRRWFIALAVAAAAILVLLLAAVAIWYWARPAPAPPGSIELAMALPTEPAAVAAEAAASSDPSASLEEAKPSPEAATSENTAAETTGTSSSPAERSTGAHSLELLAHHAAWVRVRADGEQVFAGMMKEDESRLFHYDSLIEVHCGMAGWIEAFEHGRSLGRLGKGSEIVDWSWPR